jgi:hypothetical protein
VADSFEHGDEPSGSISAENLLTSYTSISLSRAYPQGAELVG